ncbi:MAG: hypothetical protein HY829_10495 [Actinobacteria bacterium]|nr:hypothetical protein [Actinomycetota bacterium]
MGTVPTPADPPASTGLTSAQTHTWQQTLAFLLKPPACRVLTNAATPTSAGVQLIVPFAAETVDNVQSGDTAMHSTSTNNDKVFIRTAGRYDIALNAFVAGAAGGLNAVVLKNGVQVTGEAQWLTGNDRSATLTDTILCAVGDYLQVGITTPSAAALSTSWPVIFYVKWVSN